MPAMFRITYEIVTPESAEYGEAEECGVFMDNVSFGEAMSELRWHKGGYVEADCCPVQNPRWFTFFDADENYATGARTSYSLHIPEHITESSRMRIASLLGCYGVR